jgi:hypothetical protein
VKGDPGEPALPDEPAPRFLQDELEEGARRQAAARAEIEARKGKDR